VPATTKLADDHWSSMDTEAHGEIPSGRNRLLSRDGMPMLKRLDHAQPGTNATLDCVFMCLRMAKICYQSIAQIMRDISLKSVDDFRACGMRGLPNRM
jgi:hypothetical protein